MYPVRHVGNLRHMFNRPAVYSSLFQRHGSTAKFLKKILEKGGKKLVFTLVYLTRNLFFFLYNLVSEGHPDSAPKYLTLIVC